MRYSSLVVLCLGLTVSFVARADFSGSWSGSGNVSGGIDLQCDSVSVEVTQTSTELSLTNGDAECGFLSETMPDQTFQIKGNQLWQNNQQVGTISPTTADATLSGTSYTAKVSLALTSPSSVDVSADVVRSGSNYHVTGTLQKSAD